MFGMMIKVSIAWVFLLAGSLSVAADIRKCHVSDDYAEIQVALENSIRIDVGSLEIPVPSQFSSMQYSALDGRGLLRIRRETRAAVDQEFLGELNSILLTEWGSLDGSENFVVLDKCSILGLDVATVGVLQDELNVHSSNIRVIQLEDSATLVLFGGAFERYLGLLIAANSEYIDH